jgi:hypothetical protein
MAHAGTRCRIMVGTHEHRACQCACDRRHDPYFRRSVMGATVLQNRPGRTRSLTGPQLLLRSRRRGADRSTTRHMPTMRTSQTGGLGLRHFQNRAQQRQTNPIVPDNDFITKGNMVKHIELGATSLGKPTHSRTGAYLWGGHAYRRGILHHLASSGVEASRIQSLLQH